MEPESQVKFCQPDFISAGLYNCVPIFVVYAKLLGPLPLGLERSIEGLCYVAGDPFSKLCAAFIRVLNVWTQAPVASQPKAQICIPKAW